MPAVSVGDVIIKGNSAVISGLQNNTAYNVWVKGPDGTVAELTLR
jgi:hypothetical protein